LWKWRRCHFLPCISSPPAKQNPRTQYHVQNHTSLSGANTKSTDLYKSSIFFNYLYKSSEAPHPSKELRRQLHTALCAAWWPLQASWLERLWGYLPKSIKSKWKNETKVCQTVSLPTPQCVFLHEKIWEV
jgi:hypothetical protein